MKPIIDLYNTIKEIKHLSCLMLADYLGIPHWFIDIAFFLFTLISICGGFLKNVRSR